MPERQERSSAVRPLAELPLRWSSKLLRLVSEAMGERSA